MKSLEKTSKINEMMKLYNFNFSKKFGQNFLTDQNIVSKIANACEIDGTTTVIEVGPGFGALTQFLQVDCKEIVCFEIDTELVEMHKNEFPEENIEFVYDDFLKVDLSRFSNHKDLVFASNLPYYITTPIIEKLVVSGLDFKCIVIMMQKEVAERIVADCGSKTFGPLSVFVQTYFQIEKVCNVPRTCFTPSPNVDSAVLKLIPKEKSIQDMKEFEIFTKSIFSQRRKTLNNNLKKYELTDEMKNKLKSELNIDVSDRPEQLSVTDITNLYKFFGGK